MKTLLLLTVLLITANTASAGGTSTAYIPKGCTVVSAEYSTGGGDKMVQYLEVLCAFPNATRAVYIDRIASIGGFFGAGRFTQPDKIVFVEHSLDELIVK